MICKYSALQEKNWNIGRWRVKLHDLYPNASPLQDMYLLHGLRRERDRFLQPMAQEIDFKNPDLWEDFSDGDPAGILFRRYYMYKRLGIFRLAEQALVEQGVSRDTAKDTVESIMSIWQMFDLVADHFESIVEAEKLEPLLQKSLLIMQR